jgi:hypothetical protein
MDYTDVDSDPNFPDVPSTGEEVVITGWQQTARWFVGRSHVRNDGPILEHGPVPDHIRSKNDSCPMCGQNFLT